MQRIIRHYFLRKWLLNSHVCLYFELSIEENVYECELLLPIESHFHRESIFIILYFDCITGAINNNYTNQESNSGLLDQTQVRPRFFTTVPTGIFLQPSKEISIAQKRYQPRPYAYFSIPKIFAQKINKGNKENPITEIHTIEAVTTIGRLFKRRYVQTY